MEHSRLEVLQSTLISKGPSTILGSCKESYPSTILAAILDHSSAEGPACLAETTVGHSGPEVTPIIAADHGVWHVSTLTDVLRVCAPLLPDVEAIRFHSAASILIQGKTGPVQSLCRKQKGWDVSLTGSGPESDRKRSIAEVACDLESKAISATRGLVARKYARGVSEHSFETSGSCRQSTGDSQPGQRSSGNNYGEQKTTFPQSSCDKQDEAAAVIKTTAASRSGGDDGAAERASDFANADPQQAAEIKTELVGAAAAATKMRRLSQAMSTWVLRSTPPALEKRRLSKA